MICQSSTVRRNYKDTEPWVHPAPTPSPFSWGCSAAPRSTLWGIPAPQRAAPPNAPPSRSHGQPRCQAFSCFWSQTLESGWEGRSAESLRRQGWGAEGGLSEIPECGLPGGLCLEKHRAPPPHLLGMNWECWLPSSPACPQLRKRRVQASSRH